MNEQNSEALSESFCWVYVSLISNITAWCGRGVSRESFSRKSPEILKLIMLIRHDDEQRRVYIVLMLRIYALDC